MKASTRTQIEQPRNDLRRLQDRIRQLTISVAASLVALMAVGSWVILDARSGPDQPSPSELDAVLDEYVGAWNTYDDDTLRGLITDGYEHASLDALLLIPALPETVTADRDRFIVGPSELADWWRLPVEMVGDQLVLGNDPWLVVSATADKDIVLVEIVLDDDQLKIAKHYSYREGVLSNNYGDLFDGADPP